MFIDCPAIKAAFPAAGLAFHNDHPCQLQWDCHHGSTFILRVTGLTMTTIPEEFAEAFITIELNLPPRENFISAAEKFAATQGLELSVSSTRPAEWSETATLSAAHAPEAKLFIFCEEAAVTARSTGQPLRCELAVTGPFKTRLVPCRETDLIIHLEKPAAARLLSFLLAQAR
jgi:hypothetical protein